jgi:hypothetical protein
LTPVNPRRRDAAMLGLRKETAMTTERVVRIFAGAFVLLALVLGVEASPLFVSKHALWLAAFVGANLFQSGFTRLCPLESILRRLGVKTAAESALSRAA